MSDLKNLKPSLATNVRNVEATASHKKQILPAHLLVNFVQVVDQSSITKAATEMNVPYTLVAKQISRLEGLVGVPLISQTHGRVVLTSAGDALYKNASSASNDLQTQALTSVSSLEKSGRTPLAKSDRPTLNIEFSVWGIASVLRPHLSKLRGLGCGFNFVGDAGLDRAPDVSCHLGKRPKPGYNSKTLFGEEVIAVCAPHYPIPQSGLDVAGFENEPLLTMKNPDHGGDWMAFLGRDPDLPISGISKEPYPSFESYLKALKAGRGVGVGMAPLFRADLDSGTLQLASKRRLWRNRACFLGVRKDSENSELAHAFADIVDQVFSNVSVKPAA